MFRKAIVYLLLASFLAQGLLCPSLSQAQLLINDLPIPGKMVDLSVGHKPLMIKGLKINLQNPMQFDFLLSSGDSGFKVDNAQLRQESQKLIKYFLACLTIPENDLWVNLSPYEKNRMISDALRPTEMGRDLLAQDYILKQLTASMIYPEKKLGKEFWDRVYAKARQLYGTSQVPVNTFNKVWILADTAKVFERDQSAYVVSSHLKVMLEEDYLAVTKKSHTNALSAQIIREIILPEIEQEVNQGKNFATIRQIFNAFILASWYKKNLKQTLLNQVYADKSKVQGLATQGSNLTPNEIYQRYIQAYKKGVFNYIKEAPDTLTQQITPRKYFSGGTLLKDHATVVKNLSALDQIELSELDNVDLAITARMKEFPLNERNHHSLAKGFLSRVRMDEEMLDWILEKSWMKLRQRWPDVESKEAFMDRPQLAGSFALDQRNVFINSKGKRVDPETIRSAHVLLFNDFSRLVIRVPKIKIEKSDLIGHFPPSISDASMSASQEERIEVAVRSLIHGQELFNHMTKKLRILLTQIPPLLEWSTSIGEVIVELQNTLIPIEDLGSQLDEILAEDFSDRYLEILDILSEIRLAILQVRDQQGPKLVKLKTLIGEGYLRSNPQIEEILSNYLQEFDEIALKAESRLDIAYGRNSQRKTTALEVTRLVQEMFYVKGWMAQTKVRFDVLKDPENTELAVNKYTLASVIYNLINNGVNAKENVQGQVNVIMRLQEGKLQILVEDNGPGLSQSFDQLAVLGKTSKKEGTGLGLTEVKHATQNMKGLVKAENILSGGARFIVELDILKLGQRRQMIDPRELKEWQHILMFSTLLLDFKRLDVVLEYHPLYRFYEMEVRVPFQDHGERQRIYVGTDLKFAHKVFLKAQERFKDRVQMSHEEEVAAAIQKDIQDMSMAAQVKFKHKPIVYIVDDQWEEREQWDEWSRDLAKDYQIEVFSSGKNVLKRMEEVEPQLLITDTVMPQMSGPELVTQVRKRRPMVRIIAVSAEKENWMEYEGLAVTFYAKFELTAHKFVGLLDKIFTVQPKKPVRARKGDKSLVVHGGIELKTEDLKLEVLKEDIDLDATIDSAMFLSLNNQQFSGIVPVIIKVTAIHKN